MAHLGREVREHGDELCVLHLSRVVAADLILGHLLVPPSAVERHSARMRKLRINSFGFGTFCYKAEGIFRWRASPHEP